MMCYVCQGEGAAYRGRILIELSTKLDGKAEKSVEDISSDDVLVVQVLTLIEFQCKVFIDSRLLLTRAVFVYLC